MPFFRLAVEKTQISRMQFSTVVVVLSLIIAQCSAKVLWCGTFNPGWNKNGQWGNIVGLTDADPVKEAAGGALQIDLKDGQLGGANGLTFTAAINPLKNAKKTKLCLRYSLMFDNGFDFNLGGKIPGLAGYTPAATPSKSVRTLCVGGKYDSRCFSTRFMFRTEGAGTVYAYVPEIDPSRCDNTKKPKPKEVVVVCNKEKGKDLGRGKWHFVPGQWHTLNQEVVLNTVGSENGRVRVWFDTKDINDVTYEFNNFELRTNPDVFINHVMVHSFFGGDSEEWESQKNNRLFIKDFVVADSCADVVSGNFKCPAAGANAIAQTQTEFQQVQSQEQQQQPGNNNVGIYVGISVGVIVVLVVVVVVVLVVRQKSVESV